MYMYEYICQKKCYNEMFSMLRFSIRCAVREWTNSIVHFITENEELLKIVSLYVVKFRSIFEFAINRRDVNFLNVYI